MENADKRIVEIEEKAKNSSKSMTFLEIKVRALEDENRILLENGKGTSETESIAEPVKTPSRNCEAQ